jgi:heme-degrading monooxygenase HmoA
MTDKRSSLVHLAVLTPREGRADDLLASMRVMGEPADRHPGLRRHLIGRDRQTGRIVGITVWDSE